MNHIKVELDFIPVEDGLPDAEDDQVQAQYPVLFNGERLGMAWICFWGDDDWRWENRDVALDNEIVTHWAKPPKL